MGNTIKDLIRKPSLLFLTFGYRNFFNWMSDDLYIKIAYKIRMGRKLDLSNPKTFNEKLQWLKLYDRSPLYTTMVDKYEVKNYVANIIGDNYIIPTLGVWKQFDDIDFDTLPEQFVLKCTHDSGGMVICKDKSLFDKKAAKCKIERCLKHNYYYGMREWPYKNVVPRIIAEKYMSDGHRGLRDYKFFNFNQDTKFMYISEGLENHKTARISFFNLEGKLMPFNRSDFKGFDSDIVLPQGFNEMKNLSDKLAKEINNTFVRTDFYLINGHPYFSEITFFPCGGMLPFSPIEWDKKLGDWLTLPQKITR